jgi:hypothetical protein
MSFLSSLLPLVAPAYRQVFTWNPSDCSRRTMSDTAVLLQRIDTGCEKGGGGIRGNCLCYIILLTLARCPRTAYQCIDRVDKTKNATTRNTRLNSPSHACSGNDRTAQHTSAITKSCILTACSRTLRMHIQTLRVSPLASTRPTRQHYLIHCRLEPFPPGLASLRRRPQDHIHVLVCGRGLLLALNNLQPNANERCPQGTMRASTTCGARSGPMRATGEAPARDTTDHVARPAPPA